MIWILAEISVGKMARRSRLRHGMARHVLLFRAVPRVSRVACRAYSRAVPTPWHFGHGTARVTVHLVTARHGTRPKSRRVRHDTARHGTFFPPYQLSPTPHFPLLSLSLFLFHFIPHTRFSSNFFSWTKLKQLRRGNPRILLRFEFLVYCSFLLSSCDIGWKLVI